MADLILTEEEKASASWADFDDASLGKLMKAWLARYDDSIKEDKDQNAASSWLNLGVMLAIQSKIVGSDLSTYTVEGLFNKTTGEKFGDYKITVENVTQRPPEEVERPGKEVEEK